MSMPVAQQPPSVMIKHNSQDSVGPVIAIVLVIIILGVVAGMIGRLCSGKRMMGYGEYDIERWAESKCSSCIDGSISPPTPTPNNVSIPSPQRSMQQHPPNPSANQDA